MKELPIEEKAKRYDELLKKLQKAKVDNNVCDERYCCVIDDIVPELKESEDERYITQTVANVLTWADDHPKYGEQKPEWSEEDEKQIRQIERIVKNAGCTPNLQEQIHNWLKSLKDRYTWKPSDEQMQVLVWCRPLFADPKSKGILESLINDLKKLREK